MSYQVKEIFYTLQGEGANAGTPAVFCRFTGCNLWSGRQKDRATAQCQFCDTDFVGTDGTLGGKYGDAARLADQILALWPKSDLENRFVVFTGGEPLLQVDQSLLDAMHDRDFLVAVETNGTIEALKDIDWICVSPKAGTSWVQRRGDELKLVWPQFGIDLNEMAAAAFTNKFLQPMDNVLQAQNTQECIAVCLANPAWRLSVQTHKIIGVR
jgi:7-carboxy-7-deazaguanine synthase